MKLGEKLKHIKLKVLQNIGSENEKYANKAITLILQNK